MKVKTSHTADGGRAGRARVVAPLTNGVGAVDVLEGEVEEVRRLVLANTLNETHSPVADEIARACAVDRDVRGGGAAFLWAATDGRRPGVLPVVGGETASSGWVAEVICADVFPRMLPRHRIAPAIARIEGNAGGRVRVRAAGVALVGLVAAAALDVGVARAAAVVVAHVLVEAAARRRPLLPPHAQVPVHNRPSCLSGFLL